MPLAGHIAHMGIDFDLTTEEKDTMLDMEMSDEQFEKLNLDEEGDEEITDELDMGL